MSKPPIIFTSDHPRPSTHKSTVKPMPTECAVKSKAVDAIISAMSEPEEEPHND